ncbi:hypothetical protein L9F63_005263 [Diploptera punctata]|uniref:NUA/TPR/MLP1-2-like domain-containing protein n=1 Tax=Diploptera punctata TaxID=6984 RepID=A0AAD8E6H2_DIPPU|nr:hypothetical protein L9F63_005263 [Diploptera punctata]
MLKTAKQERLDTTIESMSPSAAAASRLLKSGTNARERETRKLNLYINTILEEIEEKAPLLKKQKEDYEAALENIATLTKHIDECTAECNKLRFETTEAQKLASHHSRENERLKQEMVDLAKQVCFLLKEVEEARAGFVTQQNDDSENSCLNVTSSSQIISQRLVTFSSIEQLQEKNQQLLAVVRELSKKKEEIERMNAQCDVEELTKELNSS